MRCRFCKSSAAELRLNGDVCCIDCLCSQIESREMADLQEIENEFGVSAEIDGAVAGEPRSDDQSSDSPK